MLTVSYDKGLKAFSFRSDRKVDILITERMLQVIKVDGGAIKVEPEQRNVKV